MDCSTPGLPVPQHLPEFAQLHFHCISDTVQPSHPLTSSSPAVNNSQHQGLFQSVVCLHQFSSVAQSCPTLYNPMDGSTPGLPVHHQLLEIAQTHVHQIGDAIQPSHPLSSPSPPAFNLFSIRVFSNESAVLLFRGGQTTLTCGPIKTITKEALALQRKVGCYYQKKKEANKQDI